LNRFGATMDMSRKHLIRCMLVVMLMIAAGGLAKGCRHTERTPDFVSLDDILQSGEITFITRNNAHCYYLYRGQAMGFENDLAKAFADFLGVRLKIKVAERWDDMIPSLLRGDGSVIAASLTITENRRRRVAFSDGYMPIQQHIIVNRGNLDIHRAEDLAGKTINVRRGTSYHDRLLALQEQGIDVTIRLHDDLPTEEMIRQVAEKQIDITIADSNIALLNRRYYPQTIVAGPISDKEYLGWAVNPRATQLLDRINTFLRSVKANGNFSRIYNRYYRNVDIFDFVDLRAYHRRLQSRLPQYTRIIKEAAEKHGFDWRLIAAQIYQESHFDPAARSWADAYGLMQLSPKTAESLGVTRLLDPAQNIRAGVRHLKELYDHFDRAYGLDRLLISLAAYNIGLGHIWDARNLARRLNLDPNRWHSLTETLPMLRYHKYYKNSKYGYCRGTEPVAYVKKILIYYDILKHKGIEYAARTVPQGPGGRSKTWNTAAKWSLSAGTD